MRVIILAAGQGTRLRPLTNDRPKCMVEVNGRSIIQRQLDTMMDCGISDKDIYIVTGYREDKLKQELASTNVNFITNEDYEVTNMVCSLMCAKDIMLQSDDILISYGDIIYNSCILKTLLNVDEAMAIVTDDGWYSYWAKRCDNPLDDAETLLKSRDGYITEIGQKTKDISKIQSQYIGLIRLKKIGILKTIELCELAKKKSSVGEPLWRTNRNYEKMYMTDLLQGLIDEGNSIKAVSINRGWYEIDSATDLYIAESLLTKEGETC